MPLVPLRSSCLGCDAYVSHCSVPFLSARACFQTKHATQSSRTPDHLPACSHIWPKTQSVMVRWGEVWGLILGGDRCNGRSVNTVASLLPWLRWDVLSPEPSLYLSAGPTLGSILISSSPLFLINPSTPSLSLSVCLPPRLLSAFWCPSLSDLIWRDIKDGWMSTASCAVAVAHTSVPLRQAMYQLAPDEKRRDCGLNVLDTYFNNGVCRIHTHLITELVDMDIR